MKSALLAYVHVSIPEVPAATPKAILRSVELVYNVQNLQMTVRTCTFTKVLKFCNNFTPTFFELLAHAHGLAYF